jgi:hypothetical protein
MKGKNPMRYRDKVPKFGVDNERNRHNEIQYKASENNNNLCPDLNSRGIPVTAASESKSNIMFSRELKS